MYEMANDYVEIFRLLSLNFVLLLHRNQKLSFRSKGHHGKGGNCSRIESDLHFTTLLNPSRCELVQSLRWQRSQCFRTTTLRGTNNEHARVDRKEETGGYSISKCAELAPLILGRFIPPSTLRCYSPCIFL